MIGSAAQPCSLWPPDELLGDTLDYVKAHQPHCVLVLVASVRAGADNP